MRETFHVRRITRSRVPRLPFLTLKNKVLGDTAEVSLVFASERLSQELNRKYRGKNCPANVLTFPLARNEGEIVITPTLARKDAPRFATSYRGFVALLFIHGLLHLKGTTHGSTMKAHEMRLWKTLGF